MTAAERAAWGRVGGLTAQARHGGQAMTAPARAGFRTKWERAVDPEGVLDPRERAARADRAQRAHMLRLAIASAAARAAKRRARGGARNEMDPAAVVMPAGSAPEVPHGRATPTP